MAHVWTCSCGEEFEEVGDRLGFGRYKSHTMSMGKSEGKDNHKGLGLYNSETGEQLVKGWSIESAYNKGYVISKEEADEIRKAEKQKTDSEEINKYAFKIKSKNIEYEFDPQILLLYDLTRAKYPNYKSTVGEWITECITNYYRRFPELGLDMWMEQRINFEELQKERQQDKEVKH